MTAVNQHPYTPPEWASHLKSVPTSTVKLAMTPTPINDWRLPGAPDGFKILIKRDDMTGSTLSGNKVRKLEFQLSEALEKSCRHIVTGGSFQSNHCCAVAVACAELGLQAHLFQWLEASGEDVAEVEGNLLIDRLCGAHRYLSPAGTSFDEKVRPKMDEVMERIKKETGENGYYIPMGGSNVIGAWGYFECFKEIREQSVEFDDLACVWGSGSTAAGLAIANYLSGSPYKVHGMRIGRYHFEDAHTFLDNTLAALGITEVRANDIIQIHEYDGIGYGQNTPDELDYIAEVAQETGILLDGSYTGKAVYGLRDLTRNKPEVFKGKRIMFLHSGGITSLHSAPARKALLPHSTKSKVTILEYSK